MSRPPQPLARSANGASVSTSCSTQPRWPGNPRQRPDTSGGQRLPDVISGPRHQPICLSRLLCCLVSGGEAEGQVRDIAVGPARLHPLRRNGTFFHIVNTRYERDHPTLVTTNRGLQVNGARSSRHCSSQPFLDGLSSKPPVPPLDRPALIAVREAGDSAQMRLPGCAPGRQGRLLHHRAQVEPTLRGPSGSYLGREGPGRFERAPAW